MKKIVIIIFLCGMLFAISANANDSHARVGAGGIELLKTDDIQMVSEVLEISTSKIRVTYHFLNISNHDITTTVAFPMPAFNGIGDASENQRPLDSFRVYINGVEVSVNKNRVFLIDNVDVTDKLRKIGLSDKQLFDPAFNCMWGYIDEAEAGGCRLTKAQNETILKMNAYRGQIKETAYWEQTFPAGQKIEVVHEYQPFVGFQPSLDQKRIREACLDKRTIKAMGGEFDEFGHLIGGGRDVEYILGTGRNWKGPIKNFRLILKKKSPEEWVSLCFPGKPVKTGPTTIEFSHTDFVPQDRLIIYFFH
jgi:hypothetical protein